MKKQEQGAEARERPTPPSVGGRAPWTGHGGISAQPSPRPHRTARPQSVAVPMGRGQATGPGRQALCCWPASGASTACPAGRKHGSERPGAPARHAGQQKQGQPGVPSPARWLLRAARTSAPFLGAGSGESRAARAAVSEWKETGPPRIRGWLSLVAPFSPSFFQHRDPTKQTPRSQPWLCKGSRPAEGAPSCAAPVPDVSAGSGSRRRPPGGTTRDLSPRAARGKGSERRRCGLRKCRQS